MTPEQTVRYVKIYNSLIDKHESMRKFAIAIGEEISQVCKWRYGRKSLPTRTVITICRMYPKIQPYELNPDLFPEDLKFIFKKESKK